MLQVKIRLAKHQLAWIIADCLAGQEIATLANQCGILHDSKQMSATLQEWFADSLATCFFNEASTEKTVRQLLGEKAGRAARRVQYMSVEEIKAFLKSTEQLREEGEFGEILWALLMDSRDDVQQHGYKLLGDYERSLPPPIPLPNSLEGASASDDAQGPEPLKASVASSTPSRHRRSDEEAPSKSIASPPFSATNQRELPQKPKSAASSGSNRESQLCNELEQGRRQINKFHGRVSELRSQCAVFQSKNDALEQKIEKLTEENQILKDKEHLYKESDLRIYQLERENKNLKQDLQKFSDQHGEFHELQLEREKLAVELRSVEEVASRSQQIIERMRSDFHSQIVYLQRGNDESRTVLYRAQRRMTSLAARRNTGSESRIPAEQPRVGVFVDVQNMFYAAKDRYAGRLDYIKLLDLIVGPRNLVAAYAYVVQIPEINQAGFLSLLEHNGYTIKSKDLRMRGDGSAKGDWDVGIAIDVVSMLDGLDVVILASGDGDFCALAGIIKQHDKRIEVVAFEHNTSMDLLRMADQFFPIGDEMLI